MKHLLIIAALLAVLHGAAGASTAVTSFPVNVQWITCDGTPVNFVGSSHVVISLSTDAHGGLHQDDLISVHIQSGPYLLNWNDEINLLTAGAQTITNVQPFLIISQGAGQNLMVMLTSHATFNANGILSANTFEITAVCR